jgi:hypothetical protein
MNAGRGCRPLPGDDGRTRPRGAFLTRNGSGCHEQSGSMGITEISWGVAFAAPALQAAGGWVMLQFPPPNFVAAKILFLTAPIAPLIATAIWAYSERPSLVACLAVAGIVGAPTMILTLELVRWLDIQESLHYEESNRGKN